MTGMTVAITPKSSVNNGSHPEISNNPKPQSIKTVNGDQSSATSMSEPTSLGAWKNDSKADGSLPLHLTVSSTDSLRTDAGEGGDAAATDVKKADVVFQESGRNLNARQLETVVIPRHVSNISDNDSSPVSLQVIGFEESGTDGKLSDSGSFSDFETRTSAEINLEPRQVSKPNLVVFKGDIPTQDNVHKQKGHREGNELLDCVKVGVIESKICPENTMNITDDTICVDLPGNVNSNSEENKSRIDVPNLEPAPKHTVVVGLDSQPKSYQVENGNETCRVSQATTTVDFVESKPSVSSNTYPLPITVNQNTPTTLTEDAPPALSLIEQNADVGSDCRRAKKLEMKDRAGAETAGVVEADPLTIELQGIDNNNLSSITLYDGNEKSSFDSTTKVSKEGKGRKENCNRTASWTDVVEAKPQVMAETSIVTSDHHQSTTLTEDKPPASSLAAHVTKASPACTLTPNVTTIIINDIIKKSAAGKLDHECATKTDSITSDNCDHKNICNENRDSKSLAKFIGDGANSLESKLIRLDGLRSKESTKQLLMPNHSKLSSDTKDADRNVFENRKDTESNTWAEDDSEAEKSVHTTNKDETSSHLDGHLDSCTQLKNSGSFEMVTDNQLSFTADVVSALDSVLAEQEEARKNGNGYEYHKSKIRPCLLQQSLISDEASSGASTPSEENNSPGTVKAPPLRVESSMLVPEDSLHMIAQMRVDGDEVTVNSIVTSKERKPSVSFGTNSLIQEPLSFNNMKKEKEISQKELYKSNMYGSTLKSSKYISLPMVPGQTGPTKIKSPEQSGFVGNVKNSTESPISNCAPIIAGTAAARIIRGKTPTTSPVLSGRVGKPIKSIASSVMAGSRHNAPMISGTAAAQIRAIAQKNPAPQSILSNCDSQRSVGSISSNNCASSNPSHALAAPPQLMACEVPLQNGNVLVTTNLGKSDVPCQNGDRDINETMSTLISNPVHTTVENNRLTLQKNNIKSNGVMHGLVSRAAQYQTSEMKHNNGQQSKGMDMLADIISHAVPMPAPGSANQESGEITHPRLTQHCPNQHQQQNQHDSPKHQIMSFSDQQRLMVPVGQSLSVYAAIAAQAGIPSYSANTSASNEHEEVPKTLPPQVPACVREIGKIRRFSVEKGDFGDWEDLPCQSLVGTPPRRWKELNIDESIEIPLRRGGRVRVFPNFLTDSRRSLLAKAMDNCSLYRQYSLDPEKLYLESRVHVLLSSDSSASHDYDKEIEEDENSSMNNYSVGYSYHGVTMKAKPLSLVPEVESLANDLAGLYRLPENMWNIGVDMILYRNGNDSVGWHADDTQGEALILCVVAESQKGSRPVLIKPNSKNGSLRDGDEEIIIFVDQGDAYEMDGQMQLSYEHCLPKKKDDLETKRSVVIFRQGKVQNVLYDTGTPINKLCSTTATTENDQFVLSKEIQIDDKVNMHSPKTKPSNIHFGPPVGDVVEGKRLFSIDFLVESGAHYQDSRHVNGNLRDGCDSLLINKQDPLLREVDGLCWFQYTCTRAQGGGALCKSYHRNLPIRIFRSSQLECRYAPIVRDNDKIMYRYDGLYAVKAMWDKEGNETESFPPVGGAHQTFFLVRLPKKPLDGVTEPGMHYNSMGLQELWGEIQKRRGVRKPRKFEIPQPSMKLHPIQDQMDGNRPDNSSQHQKVDGAVLTKSKSSLRPKRGNINIARTYPNDKEAFAQDDAPNGTSGSQRIIASFSNENSNGCELKVKPDVVDSDCSSSTGRPKRKSAAAARSFLQEVMHNRFGGAGKDCSLSSQDVARGWSRKRALWPKYLEDDVLSNGHSTPSARERTVSRKQGAKNDSDSDSLSHNEDEIHTSSDSDKSENCDTDDDLEGESDCGDSFSSKGLNNTEDLEEESDEEKNVKKRSKRSISVLAETASKHILVSNDSVNESRKKQKSNNSGEDSSQTVNLTSKNTVAHETLKRVEKNENDSSNSSDSEELQEGSRINVEYRDSLYRATVRKSRKKGNSRDYLIHYDGNKKSNVHWIPLSMIHDVFSEDEAAILSSPKRPRKRKSENVHEDTVKNLKFDGSSNTQDTSQLSEEAKSNKIRRNKKDKDGSTTRNEYNFSIGSEVYVEYKKILYLATVRKLRRKRGRSEYLIHYDGYKKTSDRWVQESTLSEINAVTTRRFNKLRNEPLEKCVKDTSNIHNDNEEVEKEEGDDVSEIDNSEESSLISNKTKGKSGRPSKSLNLDMGDINSGVEFLPGSCVFVEWNNALYLAKMLKRRKRGKVTEYFVHYDGYPESDNAWVALSTVYEINPQTRRIFERTADNRKKPEESSQLTIRTRRSSHKQVGRTSRSSTKNSKVSPMRIDMGDIPSGVDFLPGSTIFVEWKNGLYLAKMLKRRGKGEDMEYFIHYDGFKKGLDAWVSVSLVYEINPQTKRIFNKQRK